MLALGQGPLLVRRRSNSDERLARADDQAGRRVAGRSTGRRRSSSSRDGLDATSSRSTARAALGALVSPHSTLEELALAARLVRGLGSDNIDFRLRQTDFRGDGARRGHPVARHADRRHRARSIACWSSAASCARTIRCSRSGCARPRKKGAQVSIAALGRRRLADAGRAQGDRRAVAAAARARARSSSRRRRRAGAPVPAALAGVEPTAAAQAIAASLASRQARRDLARQLRRSSIRRRRSCTRWRRRSRELTGATLGFLTEAPTASAATSPARCRRHGGLNAQAMLAEPRKAYLLLHAEPEFDCANPRRGARGAGEGRVRRRA